MEPVNAAALIMKLQKVRVRTMSSDAEPHVEAIHEHLDQFFDIHDVILLSQWSCGDAMKQ